MSKPEVPEFQIERDYDNRCAHARSMYHMAIQDAEKQLDIAIGVADEIRQGELAQLRHAQREADDLANGPVARPYVNPTLEDVAMVKRELDERAFRQQFGITRMSEIRP